MKTWRKYRTYKRVQKLWEEYKEVARSELGKKDGKLELVSQKLGAFLDGFQSAYVEFKSSGHGMTLDAFYGDCSEVLVSLLELVEGHARQTEQKEKDYENKIAGIANQAKQAIDPELTKGVAENIHSWASNPEVPSTIADTINKALSVAELILREEKYRGIATTDAPQIIQKVLSLLDRAKSTEAKKLALRMISSMSQSVESRLEIYRLEGFKKVLRVLVEGEDGLSKEALQTLKHFLDMQEGEAAASGDTDAPPKLKEAIENVASRSQKMGVNFSVSPSVVWTITRGVVTEAQKLLGTSGEEDAGAAGDESLDESQSSVRERRDSASEKEEDRPGMFPPSRRAVAERIEEVELEAKELYDTELPNMGSWPSEALEDFLSSEVERGDDDLMKELMGVQGALKTLANKLAEAATDVQLDVMATISTLLRNSRRNKREFRHIDGYSMLHGMFNEIQDYSAVPTQLFLKDVFNILYTIILDGNKDKSVGNLDALDLLLRMIPSDCHVEVRTRASILVQELLIANPMNAVCMRRVKGFQTLLAGLTTIDLPQDISRGAIHNLPTFRLAEDICETLCYAGVILSRHDFDLLEDCTKFALSTDTAMHYLVRLLLLQCVRDMFRDRHSRKLLPVAGTILQEFVHALSDGLKSAKVDPRSGRQPLGAPRGEEFEDDEKSLRYMVQWSLSQRHAKDNAVIVLFETLAHGVCADLSQVAILQGLDGFDVCINWYLSELSPPVSSLSLWLILHMVGLSHVKEDYTPIITRILSLERVSAAKRLLCLTMLRSWLCQRQQDEQLQNLLLKLRDAGIITVLLDIVKSAGPTVAKDAFVTLGCLFTKAEGLKLWIESKIGFVSLSQLLIESSMKPDMAVMESLLHLASADHIEYIISPNLLGPKATLTDLQTSAVLNISKPAPRYVARLQSARDVPTPSAADLHNKEDSASRRSDEASSKHRRAASTSSATSRSEYRKSASAPKAMTVSSADSDKGAEDMFEDAATSKSSVVDGKSVRYDEDEEYRIIESDYLDGVDIDQQHDRWLWLYHFRSTDSAMMVLNVLPRADVPSQRVVLELLLALLDSNPLNCLIFSRMQGLNVMLSILNQISGDVQERCLQLCATVGQYNISMEETRMLFDISAPETDETSDSAEELKIKIMDMIHSICQRVTPQSFFHCDGRPGWVKVTPIERFPPAKVGYTMTCWLRITAFLKEESTLVKWLHANGSQILELYFQRIGAHDESSRVLSVRTQTENLQSQDPASNPFAFNAFNAHSFAADGKWHHIVFTQCNRTLSLYLDGTFVQSCSFTTYPCPSAGAVSKERPLTVLLFGGSEKQGGMRGAFSATSFYEGVWDAKTVAGAYAQGTLQADKVKEKGGIVEHKPILMIHPRGCYKGRLSLPAPVVDMEGIRTTSLSELVEDVFDRFSQAMTLPDQLQSLSGTPVGRPSQDLKSRPKKAYLDDQPGELGSWIQAHQTKALQEVLHEVGGVRLVLRLLAARQITMQIPALRILSAVLERWEPNRIAFAQVRGYCILLYLFSQSELSFKVFDILLDIAVRDGSQGGRSLREPDCARLIMDLLPLCDTPLQRTVLRAVEDKLFTSAQGRDIWMSTEGLGLTILLNYLRSMDRPLYPAILAIVQQTAPCWGAAETEQLLGFTIGDNEAGTEAKGEILDLLNQLFTSQRIPIDIMRNTNGFDLIFCMLDSRSDRILCGGIRMLGLLLDEAKCLKLFNKIGGFDIIRVILQQQQATAHGCTSVLQLAMGAFKVEESNSNEVFQGIIMHPFALQSLLVMLANAEEELRCMILEQILLLLEKETNSSLILSCGGLDWCRSYLIDGFSDVPEDSSAAERSTASQSQRSSKLVKNIVGKLVICGLFGDSRLLKVKELVDDEEMHEIIIAEVVSHFERDSQIPAPSASGVLRSLSLLFEPLVEASPHSDPSFFLHVVRVINRIANQNSDAVRSTMKEVAMLELRDSLLIRCLRGPLTKDGAFAIMQGFSFEWVAEKAAFREANGLLHLVHMMFKFAEERDLQIGIGCVLRNVFGPSHENRKVLLSVFEDSEIASKFFPTAISGRPSVDTQGHEEIDDVDPSEESARIVISFFEWFYEELPVSRREGIEARIQRQVNAVESAVKKSRERAVGKRLKRFKQQQERTFKTAAMTESIIAQADEKRKLRVQQCSATVVAQEKQWTRGFQDRLQAGQQRWSDMEKESLVAFRSMSSESIQSQGSFSVQSPGAFLSNQGSFGMNSSKQKTSPSSLFGSPDPDSSKE